MMAVHRPLQIHQLPEPLGVRLEAVMAMEGLLRLQQKNLPDHLLVIHIPHVVESNRNNQPMLATQLIFLVVHFILKKQI
ncbi:hypothetical protein D3C86_2103580 [compost metagenome]